jgi:predicted NAD-dependent protein-ADP-ribosyltransferase YbiA (DUF1768 family)
MPISGGSGIMRVVLKDGLLIVVPDDDDENAALDAFGERHGERLFRLAHSGKGVQFFDVGPEDIVRNRPINITSRSPAPLSLIANFARAPFELDGRAYASVEGFWQSLKFADPGERARVGALHSSEAKRASVGVEQPESFDYDGATIRAGTWDHWMLMRRACAAKFSQHEAAGLALLSTGDRPLTHKVKRDSRTIPGVIMADIWMRIRARLRDGSLLAAEPDPDPAEQPEA